MGEGSVFREDERSAKMKGGGGRYGKAQDVFKVNFKRAILIFVD